MSNIITRLDDLHSILLYCSDQQIFGKAACFTTLERICINQERGALLSQWNEENHHHEIRFYNCPPKLESKIRFILQKVIDINLITQ
jgi:hypothetical protein